MNRSQKAGYGVVSCLVKEETEMRMRLNHRPSSEPLCLCCSIFHLTNGLVRLAFMRFDFLKIVRVLLVATLGSGILTPSHAATLRKIGVSLTDLGNPFFVQIAQGVERAARKLAGPDVQVSVASSAYDLQRQIAQLDGFIKKKVDLIVLTAADPVAIEPAVRRAKAAGIRVIAVDVRAGGTDATVTTDNVQAGELACDFIANRLHGKGDVVIINGPRVTSITDRVQGCTSTFGKYPDIRLLSSDRDGGGSAEGGFAKMTDLLTLYKHIDAVFAINDPTAMGAEQAAVQAGRNEFFIVGVDGAPKMIERMKDAGSHVVASVLQLPDLQAQKAVELGLQLLNKNQLLKSTLLIPAVLLTKENVQQGNFKGWRN